MTDTDLITAEAPVTDTGAAVTSESPSDASSAPKSASGSLATMVLPELRALAGQVGVKGTSGMRKNDLIAAIREIQGGSGKSESRDSGQKGGDAAAGRSAGRGERM